MNESAESKQQSEVTIQEKKTALILLAHHHGAENIASQRFHGLLRHLPRSQYNIHVLSGPWLRPDTELSPEITPISAPLMSKATVSARLSVLFTFLRSGRIELSRIGGNSWIGEAVELARANVRAERKAGNRIVLMATYSPVDALIAGRLIAEAEGVPLVQDFRDGLVFENHGRKGLPFQLLRRALENWVMRPATSVTSVSRPLIAHFASKYSQVRAKLLYNGFDCTEISTFAGKSFYVDMDQLRIGHFGRISASDGESYLTFCKLLEFLEEGCFSEHLSFFGVLTNLELDLIERSSLSLEACGQVSRREAFQNMGVMNALLLITGKKEGVATGKIFEYLFAGRRIVLATQCYNEAARILEEIGDDDVILDFSDPSALPSVDELVVRLSQPFTRNRDRIQRFEKSEQARELALILEEAALQADRP